MPAKETRGVDIGLYADVSGTMTLVAARRNIDFEETADTIDAGHADTGTGIAKLYGRQDWNLSIDGVFLIDHDTGGLDASYKAIRDAKRGEEEIAIRLAYPGGATDEGPAIVASIGISAAYDDVATYSISLEGAGEIVETGFGA